MMHQLGASALICVNRPARQAFRHAFRQTFRQTMQPTLRTPAARRAHRGSRPLDMNNTRGLPALDQLLRAQPLHATITRWGRTRVRSAARMVLQQARDDLRTGHAQPAPSADALCAAVIATLRATTARPIAPLLNLSGTLIHTNLGRAQLPQVAADAVATAARATVNLEFDLRSGQRGDRDAEVAALLCELTGAEAATVVNNNAAALLLVLNTLAEGRAVPVARGELIEIGGSFRLPDIMARSGAMLREIGTTNRTHAKDYRAALAANEAAMVLRVHPSNFEITGFTHQESDSSLAGIAHDAGLPYVVDLGSGALFDLTRFGVPMEPMPQQVLAAGADLVLFSGDKLLGGPQAGLIVGRADLVQRVNANPLKRALRLDKLTLSALAAVLKLYGDPERLLQELPLLRHLGRDVAVLHATAERLQAHLAAAFAGQFDIAIEHGHAQLGSGSQPSTRIASVALAFRPCANRAGTRALEGLAATLRDTDPPVIGRIQNGQLLLDLRTLDDEASLVAALLEAAQRLRPRDSAAGGASPA
jgi:L-seryl-tRNA(Ser) seleniumtransferase